MPPDSLRLKRYRMNVQTLSKLLLGSTCLLMVGCNSGPVTDYSKLGLVSISGSVSLDGKPVSDAAVFFYTEDDRYCFGVTDQSGKYTARLNSEKSGVTPGEKRVEIWTSRNPLGDSASDEESEEEDPDASGKENKEQVPSCYNSKSVLRVTIESADSNLDFNLKSDCSTTTAE